jgi:hypothetical protein
MALTKLPNAVLDYSFTWADWLIGGDTIATASCVVDDTDVTVNSCTVVANGTVVVVWLGGGTAGERYHVTVTVVTAQGRTDSRTTVIDCVAQRYG